MEVERIPRSPEAASIERETTLHVTLGELVEAVAAETLDLAERVVVVEHILRTRGAIGAPRHPAGPCDRVDRR